MQTNQTKPVPIVPLPMEDVFPSLRWAKELTKQELIKLAREVHKALVKEGFYDTKTTTS